MFPTPSSNMIMSSKGGITFMYRVGGIAVRSDRLLVEWDSIRRFCFVPGGRVEYGESAVAALGREMREELGEKVEIGRLVIVADNLFELDGYRFQEAGLYFLVEFAPGSEIPEREGVFEGAEPGTSFQWIPLDELEQANLLPAFLRERVREYPKSPEYVVRAHVEAWSGPASPPTGGDRSEQG